VTTQTRNAYDAARPTPELRRLPRPDYPKHPAYGGAFPKPGIGLRFRAFMRFLPWFGLVVGKKALLFDRLPVLEDNKGPMSGGIGQRVVATRRYAPLIVRGLVGQATGLVSRRRSEPLAGTAAAIYETVVRDGIAPTWLAPAEIELIKKELEQPMADLIARRAAAKVRTFEGNQTWLNRREAGPLYALLNEVFARRGIRAAASAYLHRPVEVKGMVLQINDSTDSYQHEKFADVGIPDPATNYMHCDTSEEIMKCIVYLTDVTVAIGPFSYMRGSNRIPVGFFEGLVRRANDRAGLSGYKPETRRLFMALPGALRHKSMFGSDLVDGTPEVQAVLDNEYAFISADGNAALFDNLGVHRGGLVREGERRVLIANLG